MTEVTGPFSPATWDMSHVTRDHGFSVGDRVVFLDSLEWGDEWEYGTITDISDVGFANLKEVHTLATILWDVPITHYPKLTTTSREGLTPRGPYGMYPVTIGHTDH